MVWYKEAVFYHIYPLGLTGAPEKNDYSAPVSRLRTLWPWVDHIRDLGCNALYIGPLFQSVGHGYETTDYFTLDSRLGTNEDLKDFVAYCHEKAIRVVLDGVFNHVGRDFFAFRDLLQNRENSRYRDWFCNVRFDRDNSFHDGFSYENWGGYDLLVKLNQGNPEVRQHLLDAVDFWITEFDIDGIRLDAADVLDFGFMAALRSFTDSRKGGFFLLGEVIHGDYGRWLAPGMLHCVTNYRLHKALYSGHNDHNYFEIAHTVRETSRWKLYNFVDNHDVARIASKLSAKANFLPVHVLLYTLPGIPSVYYGSEFGIEGKKERWSGRNLRPELHLEDFRGNDQAKLIASLGRLRGALPELSYGGYEELTLTNETFAFARSLDGKRTVVTVNNANEAREMPMEPGFRGALLGLRAENGQVTLPPHSGEIWVEAGRELTVPAPVKITFCQPELKVQQEEKPAMEPCAAQKPYEEMTVEELQGAILAKLAANGPLTDRMRREVAENVYRDSLLNWVKSFR